MVASDPRRVGGVESGLLSPLLVSPSLRVVLCRTCFHGREFPSLGFVVIRLTLIGFSVAGEGDLVIMRSTRTALRRATIGIAPSRRLGICTPTTRGAVLSGISPWRVADIPLRLLFVQGIAVRNELSLILRDIRAIEHAMFVLAAQPAAPAVRRLREEVFSELSLVGL